MKKENKKVAAEKISDMRKKDEKLKAIAVEISELIDKYNLPIDDAEMILCNVHAGAMARMIVSCPIDKQDEMFKGCIKHVEFILTQHWNGLSQYIEEYKQKAN